MDNELTKFTKVFHEQFKGFEISLGIKVHPNTAKDKKLGKKMGAPKILTTEEGEARERVRRRLWARDAREKDAVLERTVKKALKAVNALKVLRVMGKNSKAKPKAKPASLDLEVKEPEATLETDEEDNT